MDDQAGVTKFCYDVTPDVALTVFDYFIIKTDSLKDF